MVRNYLPNLCTNHLVLIHETYNNVEPIKPSTDYHQQSQPLESSNNNHTNSPIMMTTAAAATSPASEADVVLSPPPPPNTGYWSSDDNLTLPSSPEAAETSEATEQTEIDETYWRKYPDLKPGSMTRELSGLEAANLNQELSEAVTAFKEEMSFSWNIHDVVCGEMHAE